MELMHVLMYYEIFLLLDYIGVNFLFFNITADVRIISHLINTNFHYCSIVYRVHIFYVSNKCYIVLRFAVSSYNNHTVVDYSLYYNDVTINII